MNLCSERSWHSSVDGVVGQGASLNLAVLSAGTHTVTASVQDSSGNSASARFQLMIENQAPLLSLISPPTYFSYVEIGDPVRLRASAVDVVDGDISSQILWSSGDVNLGVGGDVTVTLSPGVHCVQAFIENVVVESLTPNSPPAVKAYPSTWDPIRYGQSIRFDASAWDSEDGNLTNVRWYSNRHGQLGTGVQLTNQTLSLGTHRITATATDSEGAKGGSEFNVTVVQSSLLQSSVARSDVPSGQQPFKPDRLPRKRDWLVRSTNERQGVRPTFVQPSFIGAVL